MSANLRSSLSKTVILWDIDGTLLDTGGAGVVPFKSALEKHLKVKIEFDRSKLAGKTDYQIIDFFTQGTQSKKLSPLREYWLLRQYVLGLRKNLNAKTISVLGDSLLALNRISTTHKWKLGILTGNCSKGAKAKLGSAKLLNFFDQELIYCASRKLRSREAILRNAISRLKGNIVLIGDTPSDIVAAKSLSVPIISLASGAFDFCDLHSLNSGFVLDADWNYSQLKSKLEELENLIFIKNLD